MRRLLGSHIVEALLARGECMIRIFDARASALWDNEENVVVTIGSVTDPVALEAVCEGADTVFLTAAIVNYWSEYDFEWAPIEAVNVTGTENVIAACKKSSVTRLIGTSSSAVVVPYDLLNNPVEFVDESVPLASAPNLNHYIRSKVATEILILGANGSDLKTMVVKGPPLPLGVGAHARAQILTALGDPP
jgi:nucleoside-diphosphate-sugar epimerase